MPLRPGYLYVRPHKHERTAMNYGDVVRDFARRTRANLEAIDRLKSQGHEVYETTQLINSMLGLLVFPQQRYVAAIPKTPLADLQRDGWPIPRVRGTFKQVRNLNQLIRYLRNAVSHFNIEFIDPSGRGIEALRVWNMRPIKGPDDKVLRDENGNVLEEKNWEAELGVTELRGIAERFIDLLLTPSEA